MSPADKLNNSYAKARELEGLYYERIAKCLADGWSFTYASSLAGISNHVATRFCREFPRWAEIRKKYRKPNTALRYHFINNSTLRDALS